MTRHALALAASIATLREDGRGFRLGAVGIRSDGTLVCSANGAAQERAPSAHAEARVARKLDKRGVVYVARVLRSGEWALARPCPDCLRKLRARKVRKVYYTIGPGEWGVIAL